MREREPEKKFVDLFLTMGRMEQPSVSEWERRRYVPKPGEPSLPPQLSELANKSSEEVMRELNRLPFFMTELDESDGSGGENTNLEALKSLAYEGEPAEIAGNFKNQGNECYRAKQYGGAVEYYSKGLEVGCDDAGLNAALYLNRAACNLELKNYRRCIEDCKRVLSIDEASVKACFRAGRAFFMVERFDEAREIVGYGLGLEPENEALKLLLELVDRKTREIEAARERKEQKEKLAKMKKQLLTNAIKVRRIDNIKSSQPIELLEEAKIRLEDDTNYESQLIFPAVVIYPTIDEFDFIAEISELTTAQTILETVLDRPDLWFEDPKHANFTPKNLDCFMETVAGGLVKVGKKVAVNQALMSDTSKAPLFDNGLRLYVVPKTQVSTWISSWDKKVALAKRHAN